MDAPAHQRSLCVIRLDRLYQADPIGTSVGASAAASALSRLIGLIRGVALAWMISQAQFGLFGVALLVVNILLPVCSVGLYEGVTRYAPFHEAAGTLRVFVMRSLALVIVIATAATAVFVLLAEWIGPALFSTAQLGSGTLGSAQAAGSLMRASIVCVWTLVVYHTLLGVLRGLRMFRAVGVAEVTTAFLFTLLAVAGALAGYQSARALITAYAMASVVSVLVFGPGLLMCLAPATPTTGIELRRPQSSLVAYSAWAAGTAILWHALAYYPMWYLLKVSDGATVGVFHAVRIVTQFVQIGAVMLTAVVSAHVTRAWEHTGRDAAIPQVALLTKACLIILFVGAVGLSLLRPLVMRLFPAAFASGNAAYDPLILFFYLVGVAGLVAVRLNLLEQPRLVCVAWCIGALVNVAVSYLLLPASTADQPAIQTAALRLAAWSGVAGAAAAAFICIVLVSRRGVGLDAPALLLAAAGFSVAFGWLIALLVAVVFTVVAVTTGAVFSPSERRELRSELAKRNLPLIRARAGSRPEDR